MYIYIFIYIYIYIYLCICIHVYVFIIHERAPGFQNPSANGRQSTSPFKSAASTNKITDKLYSITAAASAMTITATVSSRNVDMSTFTHSSDLKHKQGARVHELMYRISFAVQGLPPPRAVLNPYRSKEVCKYISK